jgi:rhodanese-related sulfurtransferase
MIRLRSLLAMLSLLPTLVRPVRVADMEKVRDLARLKVPDVKQLSTEALANWIADTNRVSPLLVDARSDTEFRVSHLPKALLAESVEEVKRLAGGSDGQVRPVVVYCAVGYRSSAFVQKLQKAGLTNVFSLDGSIFQWANEGRDLYQGRERVNTVHPYNRKWGQLLKPERRAGRPD